MFQAAGLRLFSAPSTEVTRCAWNSSSPRSTWLVGASRRNISTLLRARGVAAGPLRRRPGRHPRRQAVEAEGCCYSRLRPEVQQSRSPGASHHRTVNASSSVVDPHLARLRQSGAPLRLPVLARDQGKGAGCPRHREGQRRQGAVGRAQLPSGLVVAGRRGRGDGNLAAGGLSGIAGGSRSDGSRSAPTCLDASSPGKAG